MHPLLMTRRVPEYSTCRQALLGRGEWLSGRSRAAQSTCLDLIALLLRRGAATWQCPA